MHDYPYVYAQAKRKTFGVFWGLEFVLEIVHLGPGVSARTDL